MNYALRSEMTKDLARLPRPFRFVLLPLAYLGALLAPAAVLNLPFTGLHSPQEHPAYYWCALLVVCSISTWILYRTGRSILFYFRNRTIHAESVILFVGVGFALFAVLWLHSPK
jgi:hypothetical protein